MADVKIYLEWRNSQKIMLPVNPEELSVKWSGTNTTESIVGLGDITVLNVVGLQGLTIKSFIAASGGSYIVSNSSLGNPETFIEFIKDVRESKEPIRIVVTGLNVNINIQVGIQSFGYSWSGGDEDMYYTLQLQQWVDYAPKVYTPPTVVPDTPAPPTEAPPRENIPKAVTIGCTVMANGQLHKDSFGGGPGQTESGAQRKVNFIKEGRSHPYHLTTMEGGWRGWVTADSVEVID
jgi:hypothetical protein